MAALDIYLFEIKEKSSISLFFSLSFLHLPELGHRRFESMQKRQLDKYPADSIQGSSYQE